MFASDQQCNSDTDTNATKLKSNCAELLLAEAVSVLIIIASISDTEGMRACALGKAS